MNIISGNGYDKADLMVVADYARKADETANECISGFYARKLSEYLKDSEFRIDQCYKTCVIKIYEKGLGVGTWKSDRTILKNMHEAYGINSNFFTDILIDEINSIQPTVIIAMGEYALRVLTGKENITNFRGSVLPLAVSLELKLKHDVVVPKVVACEHISIEHTQEEQKFLLRMDIAKAVDLIYNPAKPLDDHQIVICRNVNDWIRFRDSQGAQPEWMTSDIETHYGFITCMSASYDGYKGGVIPFLGSRNMEQLEKARLAHMIGRDLENPNIEKNNQNISYDKRIYQRFGFRVAPVKWDTMLAASVIAAEFPKRLGFLTSIYCDGAYHKDEGKEFDPSKHSFDQLYEYCAKDSIKTHQIMLKQYKDLEELGALSFFQDLMMRWFDMYYDVDSCGILQDKSRKRDLEAKYEGLRSLKTLEIRALTGREINMNSPSQIGKFMEESGFPVLRHRVDSGFMVVNTDVESMKKMRSAAVLDYKRCTLPYEHAIRFINLILLIRRIDKVLEYINVGVHPDGRIRTSVKIGGTSSGRTSNGKTPDQVAVWEQLDKGPDKGKWVLETDNLGGSLQTVTKHGFIIEGDDDEEIEDGIIGKDVREMYIPDSGYVFVEIDRSQAEARVVDLLAEDYDGLEEYGKIDKHSKNASIIWPQYTWQEIKAMYKSGNDEGAYMRQIGKKAVHATNYDMGAYRLSNLANISVKFATECLHKVHTAKPWIKEVFHRSVEAEVRNSRRLDNPYGRPRMFYKKLDGHGIKVAYSWYPQSTISDGTKLAMLRISDQIDKLKAYLIAENHDSITAIVKRGYIRTYVNIVREALMAPVDFTRGTFQRDYQLIIPVEVSIGRHNWGQMNEVKKMKLAA